ncbi:MAG: hypothetical protein IAF38_21100, partial [Bacteroidia bacterium]|nr:hypothetical protein [Bacteroidia bacterium]
MTANKLALKNFSIQSFGGISKTNPIIITFPDGARLLKTVGDQGTNKTSTMGALEALLSANIAPNAINTTDKEKKASGRFYGKDGKLYQSKITKATFTLEQILTDENGPVLDEKGQESTQELKKPITLIRTLVGPLGITPMELKSKNPADQIAWLRSYQGAAEEEAKAKEAEIKKKIKTAYDRRTTVNRDIRILEAKLQTNDFFIHRKQWDEKFLTIEKEPELLKKIEEKRTAADQFIRGEARLETVRKEVATLENDITSIEEQIKNLQLSLENKKAEVLTKNEAIETGEKFLAENKEAAEHHTALTEELKQITELKLSQASYKVMEENVLEKIALAKEA